MFGLPKGIILLVLMLLVAPCFTKGLLKVMSWNHFWSRGFVCGQGTWRYPIVPTGSACAFISWKRRTGSLRFKSLMGGQPSSKLGGKHLPISSTPMVRCFLDVFLSLLLVPVCFIFWKYDPGSKMNSSKNPPKVGQTCFHGYIAFLFYQTIKQTVFVLRTG